MLEDYEVFNQIRCLYVNINLDKLTKFITERGDYISELEKLKEHLLSPNKEYAPIIIELFTNEKSELPIQKFGFAELVLIKMCLYLQEEQPDISLYKLISGLLRQHYPIYN